MSTIISMQSVAVATTNQNEKTVVDVLVDTCFKGNIFYPGAGFDGGYVNDVEIKLRERGFINVNVDKYGIKNAQSGGTLNDTATILFVNDFFEGICNEPKNVNHIVRFPSEGQQLNFIGYSYGGLVAAINAMQYTRITGCDVDNLVLIAAPILSTNLNLIKLNSRIKNLIIHDLIDKGDVLRSGASDKMEIVKAFSEIMFVFTYNYGERHFIMGKWMQKAKKGEGS